MKNRFFFSAADWIAIILLAVAGWKFTYGIENYIDINFHDPSFYLLNGVTLPENGLPEAEDGPLYAVWFHLLSLTQADRIELFYRDYKLLTMLLPLMIYLVLRRVSVSSIAALVISAFSLISFFNFPSFTRVSHFAVCVVLASLVCVSFARRFRTATVMAAWGALLASYVRPELFLAWLLFALMAVAAYVYGFGKAFRGRDFVAFSAFVLGSAAALFFLGSPVAGERSGVAFIEHFAVNWVSWTGSSLDPWTNAQKIFSGSFGDAVGVPAALWANPGMFLKHVATNLKALLHNIAYLFSLHTAPVITGTFLLVVLCMVMGACRFEQVFHCKRNMGHNKNILLCGLVYLMAMLAAVTVIHPRLHYLVLVCVLLVVAAASIFLSNAGEGNGSERGRLILAGLVIIGFVPCQNFPAVCENVATIRLVQSLEISREVNVLNEGGMPQLYLGENFQSCYPGWKKEPFSQFLLDRKINMVIVTDRLRADARLTDDEEWSRFLERYSKSGFVKLDVPGTGRAVLVQKSLIDPDEATSL